KTPERSPSAKLPQHEIVVPALMVCSNSLVPKNASVTRVARPYAKSRLHGNTVSVVVTVDCPVLHNPQFASTVHARPTAPAVHVLDVRLQVPLHCVSLLQPVPVVLQVP